MTALKTFRDRARANHPGLTLELEGGVVTLRSIAFLDDVELRQLKTSQRRLEELDNDSEADPASIRAEMVNLLSGISTDKALTARELDREPLAVLSEIMAEYGQAEGEDSPKSEGHSPGSE